MSSIKCRRCGHINPKSADRCEHCYKKLDDQQDGPEIGGSTLSSRSSRSKGTKSPPPKISSPMSSGTKSLSTTRMSSKGSTKIPLPFTPSSITFPGSPPKTLLTLPSHMGRYGHPHLEGFVIDLREMQSDKPLTAKDFAGDALLAVVLPKFALASVLTKFSRREKQVIYKIQVELSSGGVRVALIVDGKSIPPEIGEYVSIWGKNEKGIIIVQSLFNHITGAEI